MKNVYYAHSMMIYNTKEEAQNINFLRSIFPDLVCPNTDLNLGDSMESYLDYVRFRSSLVVATEYVSYVGRGVYLEVKEALVNGITALVMRDFKLYPIKRVEIHDPQDWKVHHAKIYPYII